MTRTDAILAQLAAHDAREPDPRDFSCDVCEGEGSVRPEVSDYPGQRERCWCCRGEGYDVAAYRAALDAWDAEGDRLYAMIEEAKAA